MSKIKRIFGYGGCQIPLMDDGTVRYHYWLGDDLSEGECTFSLWSEVGEPYRPKFQKIIIEYGLGILRGQPLLNGDIGDILFCVTTDDEDDEAGPDY